MPTLRRRDVIALEAAFAIGMVVSFVTSLGHDIHWLALAGLVPLYRAPIFWRNHLTQAATAANIAAFVLIVLGPDSWHTILAAAIVAIGLLHHAILIFDTISAIRRDERDKTIAEIDERTAKYLDAPTP